MVTRGSPPAVASPSGSRVTPGQSTPAAGSKVLCYVARRLDISWCENGFDVDQQVLIEDNVVHHLHNSQISPTTI
jgi:hypothetical protein